MSTLRILLPDSLKSFVDEQVVRRGLATRSAYVRELIHHDRDRQHLRSLLVEGTESAPSIAADSIYFDNLRAGTSQDPRLGRGF